LPSYERVLKVSRKNISPVWTRSYPVSKEPKSIGEHLRKRRFELGMRQAEAASKLGVSCLTLSLWECDRVYPTWRKQATIVAYLGYNPFTNPALGAPGSNESSGVAILSENQPKTLGESVLKRRIELRKTRKQCAMDIGVSVKTLWSIETDRRQPTDSVRAKLEKILGAAISR